MYEVQALLGLFQSRVAVCVSFQISENTHFLLFFTGRSYFNKRVKYVLSTLGYSGFSSRQAQKYFSSRHQARPTGVSSAGSEADHLSSSSAEFGNVWSSTFTPHLMWLKHKNTFAFHIFNFLLT
jgi:hypothetical protein